MNIYMTNGTYDFLARLKEKHSDQTVVLMHEADNALLLHETSGKSFFSAPRKYEVIDSSGELQGAGFAVFNNIPVSDEGRPVFEYRFKNRARLIENEPGFKAIRVLRPLSNDTYIILTLWESEQSFLNWQESKAYEKAHEKRGTEKGIDTQQPQIFTSASYVTKYHISAEQ